MSNVPYPLYTRLSDSLERELMLAAIADEQKVSLRDLLARMVAAVRHSAVAVYDYTLTLGETMRTAREKDPQSQYSL